ncbi:MAG TPA: hypothetical protein VGA25_07345 [Burkholderiales bacterium]|jgi:hypothetical protein
MRGLTVFLAGAVLVAAARGAEDPAVRAMQQHQLQRQQQQEALQLRMLQQQRGAQNPPGDAQRQQATDLQQVDQQQRQRRAMEQLQIDQQQRQQQLHDRQGIEPGSVQPTEDAAGQENKAQMELRKAREQSQQQLRRFESESQAKPATDSARPLKLE